MELRTDGLSKNCADKIKEKLDDVFEYLLETLEEDEINTGFIHILFNVTNLNNETTLFEYKTDAL